jgi:hypothetical protein
MVEGTTFETGSVAHGSDQHTKEPVITFMEGVVPHTNPPLTDPVGPLLIEQPSTTYFDAFSSYHLPEGLEISPPLSTTLVVDPARAQSTIVGASSFIHDPSYSDTTTGKYISLCTWVG